MADAAQGQQLSQAEIGKLAGKTCWGWFDRGTQNQNSMGAIYIRFGATTPVIGHLWSKSGQAARDNPRRDVPDQYDDRGQTTPIGITSVGTELTFYTQPSGDWRRFDWYFVPNGGFQYKIRAQGVGDRGAVGVIECN